MTDILAKYTEQAVGADHPSLADVINRIALAQALNGFRLKLSGGNLTLEPVTGNCININGRIHQYTVMPTLGAGGLGVGTLYYIYLYDNAGTATLEASATGYTVTTLGRPDKTGDATRRLVGMARPIAGPAWVDSATQRYVRSYDNRPRIQLNNKFTALRQTASATYVELNTEIRLEFLVWTGEIVESAITATVVNSGNNSTNTSIGFDGTTAEPLDPYIASALDSVVGISWPKDGLAEGYHYATLLGKTSAGTGSWRGGGAGSVGTVLTATIGR
jgi:hypothetical protein